MKNILNIKYIVVGVAFALGILSFNTVSASTYSTGCNQGGNILSEVSIDPVGPFTTASTNFDAKGRLYTNNCVVDHVSLDVKHNGGSNAVLIPNTTAMAPNSVFPFGIPAYTTYSSFTTPATYLVNFITGLDEPTIPIQNYGYESNLGSIMGICHVMPDPYSGNPGYMRATRDAATNADAISRGVTSVDYTFSIRTDNYPNPQISFITATFYPGDLTVDIPGYESGLNHDGGGYCSSIACEGWSCPQTIVEHF